MRRIKHAVLLVMIWAATVHIAFSAMAEVRLVRTWDRNQLGADAMAWTAAHGPDGALYVGANTVLRFDGDNWSQLPVGKGYAVRAVSFDGAGRMWTGAVGVLGYRDYGQNGWSDFHPVVPPFAPGESLGDVWQIFARSTGVVVVTQTHVLRLRAGVWQIWGFPGGRRLAAGQVGEELLIHHGSTGLWTLTESGPVLRLPAERIEASGIITFGVGSADGRPLLLARNGLFRMEEDRLVRWSEVGSKYVSEHQATSACSLGDGRWAIGTLGGGVVLLSADGKSLEVFAKREGLPSDTVFSVTASANGDLWCTSPAFVSVFRPDDQTRVYREVGSDRIDGLHSLAGFEGKVFLAADSGLLRRSATVFELGFPGFFTELLAIPDGVLAVRPRNIDLIRDDKISSFYTTEQDVACLSPDLKSGHWLLSDGRRLVRVSGHTEVHRIEEITNLPDIAKAIAPETDNSIWVATTGGVLLRVSRNDMNGAWRIETCSVPGSGLPSSTLVARVGERIAVLTSAGGFELSDRGPSFQMIPGLPARPVLAVSRRDAVGRVWLTQHSGFNDGATPSPLGLLQETDRHIRWVPYEASGTSVVGRLGGIQTDDVGGVWLLGSGAVVKIVPRPLAVGTILGTPWVECSLPRGGSVGFDNASVRFRFGSRTFLHRDDIRFQTRLLGSAAVWAAPSNFPEASFSALREGRYQFQVRTVDAWARESEPATWEFTVFPPWYRTLWAQVGGTLTVMGLLALGVRWRLREARLRQEKLEATVAIRTEELRRANAAKADFLANISHEIGNPVHGILGLTETLKGARLTSEEDEAVRSIDSCGRVLHRMFTEMLDMAKIDSRELAFEYAEFRPIPLLATCAAMMKGATDAAGCVIAVESTMARDAVAVGDAERIQQILMNFVGNAAKYAPGSLITLGAEFRANGYLRLSVRDDGPGIAPEDLGKLFTRFTRLEASRTARIPGSGLGLSLCRLFAEGMGGEVSAVSELGAGSTFLLDLPPRAADARPDRAVVLAGSALSALVVDDVRYSAEATTAVLRSIGVRAVAVGDSSSALAAYRAEHFDVVFLDWNLGQGTDGGELMQRLLKSGGVGKRPLFVSLTAHSSDEHRRKAEACGFDAVLCKPLLGVQVAAMLAESLAPLRSSAPVATSVGTLAAGLNLRMLEVLAAGEAGGLAHQIERYLEQMEENLAVLRRAIQSNVRGDVNEAAHRIVADGRMIGATALAEAAAKLERESLRRTGGPYRDLMNEVESAVADVRLRLNGLNQKDTAGSRPPP